MILVDGLSSWHLAVDFHAMRVMLLAFYVFRRVWSTLVACGRGVDWAVAVAVPAFFASGEPADDFARFLVGHAAHDHGH
jgi:hypothetical protein